MATVLENESAWSTTAISNANVDTGINWAEGQDAATVNNSARGMMAARAKARLDLGGALVAGGTANALTVTTNQVLSAAHLAAGLRLSVLITATNTASAVTIAVDGLTPVPIKRVDGSAVTAGTIKVGMCLDLVYNAGASEFRALNLPVLGAASSLINVLDYGVDPAGTGTANAAGFQAAIAAAEAIDYAPTWHALRPVIYVPAGAYVSNEIVTTKPVTIRGDGRNSTQISLAAGRTGSLFTLGVIDRGGTSVDDFDHPRIEKMCLLGNRTDATTTGTSHGINCPYPGWAVTVQYMPAFIGEDLVIEAFTGNGIATFENRNLLTLSRVISHYNNDNGLYMVNNYDSLINSCEFGNNKNAGIREVTSFNTKVSQCDIYDNDNAIYRDTCGGPSIYSSCTIQHSNKDGFVQASGKGPIIIGCFFLQNGSLADNTYANIAITGTVEIGAIVGNFFEYVSGNRVKYLVSGLAGATLWSWSGNVFSNATLAYGTGTFDAPSKMAVAGDVSGQLVHGPGAEQLLYARAAGVVDGIATPTTVSGVAYIFVDAADGDLKVRFGDGTTKLIVTDT